MRICHPYNDKLLKKNTEVYVNYLLLLFTLNYEKRKLFFNI